jgi:hypothetical protein
MSADASKTILLYRYLDAAAALKTIEECRFRISRLRDLNDPFEWRFGYKPEPDNPEAEKILNAWRESVFASRNEVLGIICFSATYKEPVLWSHYADKHRGVAFEIDCPNNPNTLKKISYPPERVSIDLNTFARFQRNNDIMGLKEYLLPLMKQTIQQKSPGWAYEQEYRFEVELAGNLQTSAGNYFVGISDNFLTRVILGWKCQLEEQYVLKALQAVGLTSTKVVRAKISPDSYEVLC